jgi:pimeloyl-ACP methyl ester carboxylesterase
MENLPIKNVVLVHGAFVDGSAYEGVYHVLVAKGYHVMVVQNPLTSLDDDVIATNEVIGRMDGPVILVGNSWGGAVITEAGNHAQVAALVYIAAIQPDNGETALQWIGTMPPPFENAVLPPDENGIVYNAKDKFHAGYCADIDAKKAEFMWASQGAFYAKTFVTPITKAAWRTKPSYAVIATEDKMLHPDIQRNMYNRSKTKITEIKGSHAVYISQPELVAEVIIAASINV